MTACRACKTKRPKSLKGSDLFLSNVKLKSKVNLPAGKVIPPSM